MVTSHARFDKYRKTNFKTKKEKNFFLFFSGRPIKKGATAPGSTVPGFQNSLARFSKDS
ncbi:hypothetical protein FHW36_107403 [Chitinophaga polysaccharea]|uniref:Uncharacterized protein n=1 Tax=Chitinophaga polysaccharea TaxID=1293035 RepID=A0A561PH69_9BACT|nr:hypothetical protein FHW36_107403 [Chitinophaga polysaccharea]